MAMKSLVLQLKLMTLVMVYVEICARGDVSVNCNKAKGINMQNHAVARVNQYNLLKLGTIKNSKPFFSLK